jgi:rhamnogalacturonyl hydrolase YesR
MTTTPQSSDIVAVGKKLVAKYLAVHHDLSDRVDFGLEQALALYGVLRLTELNVGIDGYGLVDKKIACLLTSGPAGLLPFAQQRMGGLAGAYRFYQGGYKVGEKAGCLLYQCAAQLSAAGMEHDTMTVERLLAVAPFLAMAAPALRDDQFYAGALRHWSLAEAALLDHKEGLFHPGAGSREGTPDFWGRATGYALMALVEILRYLPHTRASRTPLIASLQRLVDRLLPLQTANGLWRQVLTTSDSYEETSGSALITYALFTALAEGWLPASYAAAADRAWQGVLSQVALAGNGNVSNVCATPTADASRNEYLAAPVVLNGLAGFGPLMLATAAAYVWERSRQWQDAVVTAPSFARSNRSAVERFFHRLHEACEKTYHGDGSWGAGTMEDPAGTFDEIIKESQTRHPIIRATAYCVMGYLDACRCQPNALYEQRAREGRAWLLHEQEADGSSRLWTRRDSGQTRHHGCLFETGIAGSALLRGYECLGDERYLAASARAAQWAAAWPVDLNVNFNAFALWHMADHYRVTQEAALLDVIIYKMRQAIMTPQQPSGGWPGHNSWTWYHGVNLRAFGTLYRALPVDHAFRPLLETAMDACQNYLLALQAADGSLHPNPEHSSETSRLMYDQLGGMIRACESRPDPAMRRALDGLVAYRISDASGDPDLVYNQEKGVWGKGNATSYIYALGAYLALDGPAA